MKLTMSFKPVIMAFLMMLLLSEVTPMETRTEKATFAGGCFWCMVHPFDSYEGVISVISGYTGGNVDNPSYEEVCSGKSGHLEAVEITFDPSKIGYDTLLDIFWRQINPTDAGGQFVDRGEQYSSAVFYHSPEQKALAESSLKALDSSKRFENPIVTAIRPAETFYPAENYHQNYHTTNSHRYGMYRMHSGRDVFIDKYWNK